MVIIILELRNHLCISLFLFLLRQWETNILNFSQEKNRYAKIIFEEETAFLKTLGKGLKMIEKMIADLRKEQ